MSPLLKPETALSPPLMSPLRIGAKIEPSIYKFVLTGGPCAGKTTALARLSFFFR